MTAEKKRLTAIVSAATIIMTVVIIWLLWGNTALEVNTYTVNSDKIPEEFYGYRIAHVSDLHNAEIGEDNEKLLSALSEAEPDIIAITGDMIDSRNTDIETAIRFAEKAVKIAPCYYVTGNHEARVPEYDELKKYLIDLGIAVLDNKYIELEQNGKRIKLIGLDDPSFTADYLFDGERHIAETHLSELLDGNDGYSILLSHRPELFAVYSESGVDLVLSGHAHGGQIRLPLLGGIFAPHQGFFPEYDAGLYTEGDTNMIVSRGIGNSLFPLRVNNRPEIILIELQG